MRRRAFTLIEMMAVTVVLAIIAAIVAPNMASSLKASRKRDYLESIQRLTVEARHVAESSGTMAVLIADEDGNLEIQQTEPGAQEPSTLRRVPATQGIAPTRFVSGASEVGAGDWQAQFFPDGTSDVAGLEFDEAGTTWSLSITKNGTGQVSKSELVEAEEDRWPAGDYVQRS